MSPLVVTPIRLSRLATIKVSPKKGGVGYLGVRWSIEKFCGERALIGSVLGLKRKLARGDLTPLVSKNAGVLLLKWFFSNTVYLFECGGKGFRQKRGHLNSDLFQKINLTEEVNCPSEFLGLLGC